MVSSPLIMRIHSIMDNSVILIVKTLWIAMDGLGRDFFTFRQVQIHVHDFWVGLVLFS